MRVENLQRFKDINIDTSDHYYLVYKPLIRDLKTSIEKYATGIVLDIGCGNKPYEVLFSKNIEKYLGCDIVQSSLEKVDIICEAHNVPLESGSVDTVLCTQVIEHVPDHNKLIQEIHRLLKMNGCLILSGPMYWHIHEEPHDYFRFTKYGFKYILESNGFKIHEMMPNGGKWATLGQMIIHTFPHFLIKHKFVRRMINSVFYKLDVKHFNEYNTMNYVVVAQKV